MADKSAVSQITMTYSPEQDRMLLRIGTAEQSEYKLWLTRRFIRVLWAALMKTMERDAELKKDLMPQVRDAMLAMQHQEAVQAANFGQTHAQDNRDLTSNTGPLLVKGGTLTPGKAGITQLKLDTENGTSINVALNKQLMHAFCHMTISTSFSAEWDLELAVGDPGLVSADTSKVH
ncbi:MAG: hypothetical protein HQ483_18770 [Rhodospirillales bacterium]|nr:hypothetical protein [Rhodospirillales bacterium]